MYVRIQHSPRCCLRMLRTGRQRNDAPLDPRDASLFETLKWNIIPDLEGGSLFATYHSMFSEGKEKYEFNYILVKALVPSQKLIFGALGFIAHLILSQKTWVAVITIFEYWPYISSSAQLLIFCLYLTFHMISSNIHHCEMLRFKGVLLLFRWAIIELVYYLSIRSSKAGFIGCWNGFSVNLFFRGFQVALFPSWDVNWVVTLDIRCQ